MKCRHCGMELEEGTSVCPNCRQNTAKPKAWQIVLFAVLGFLVAFALTLVIMKDQGVELDWLDPTTWFHKEEKAEEPEKTQAEETKDPLYDYGLARDSYTSQDAAAATAVAAKVGDLELTNGELNAYYWTGVYSFLSNYSYYLEYFGLDLTLPLDQQTYPDGAETWQQFFLSSALTEWHKYSALYMQGQKEGYQMSQEMHAQLDAMHEQVEGNWKDNGFESMAAMIAYELGPLTTVDGYWHYMEVYHYAMDYFEYRYASLEPSEAEVEAYFNDHASELSFTKDSRKHNVRHILIEPKGGTTDEYGTTTYTEEEWEACRKEAQAILDSWDGTEEGFAKLAEKYTADTGSASAGGMYEDLTESTNFVDEFKNWYLDPIRKPGDTGLVTSVYGYHVMFYSSGESYWQEETKALAWQDNSEKFVEGIMNAWPVTIYDELIALGDVALS